MNKIRLTANVNGKVKSQETESWIDLRAWLNELRDLGFGSVSNVQIEQV